MYNVKHNMCMFLINNDLSHKFNNSIIFGSLRLSSNDEQNITDTLCVMKESAE